MPNLNKVHLMGHLTRDPELRYTPSNMPVANIGIAINRRWKRKDGGEDQEETTYVDCDAFDKAAETIVKYLKKGSPIYVEGRLRLDQWQSKQGENRSKLKVVIDNFQFLESKGGGGQQREQDQTRSPVEAPRGEAPAHDDTIPF